MLTSIFNCFHPVTVMVIGDFMLDSYIRGDIHRISPEAPVPIVKAQKEEYLPGGAGNVVLNLQTLGASVIAVGRTGHDLNGMKLRQSLDRPGVNLDCLLAQSNFPTPIKSRVIAGGQQIIRIDFEDNSPLPTELEEQVIQNIARYINQVSAVAISDYQKGFLSPSLLQKIIAYCKEQKVPVIVDPKGVDFSKYKGATLIKPNLQEAYTAAGLARSADLKEVADKIFAITQAKSLIITRSEHGITLFDQKLNRQDFAAKVREVKDVTGAGDTVLATLVLGIVNGLDLEHAIELANIAAGISVERVGCMQITLAELANRLLDHAVENKIFEAHHLYAMIHALKNRSFIIIDIPFTSSLNASLYKQICKIKSQYPKEDVVLHIRGECDANCEFAQLMASLSEINWVIIQGMELQYLCKEVQPQALFTLDSLGNLITEASHLSSIELNPSSPLFSIQA